MLRLLHHNDKRFGVKCYRICFSFSFFSLSLIYMSVVSFSVIAGIVCVFVFFPSFHSLFMHLEWSHNGNSFIYCANFQLQSLIWIAMSICAILAYYCVFSFRGLVPSLGSITEITLCHMYFHGNASSTGKLIHQQHNHQLRKLKNFVFVFFFCHQGRAFKMEYQIWIIHRSIDWI